MSNKVSLTGIDRKMSSGTNLGSRAKFIPSVLIYRKQWINFTRTHTHTHTHPHTTIHTVCVTQRGDACVVDGSFCQAARCALSWAV